MEKKENILETEKIGKLMMKFSIPCIISLLVNSLYNIVDQIFIGLGVGYLGNGATNVVFPLTMIALSFALMFGDGASAYLSLKLGEKKVEEAAKGVGNDITISVIIALILCTITLAFLPQLLNLFGCTDSLRGYAKDYGYIIGMGLPFMIVGTALNSIIRADGNPKYAMTSMIVGALLNVVLDPIFIFVFHMGVEGAAIATVISQILTFIINVMYIKKFRSISLTKDKFMLDIKVIGKVTMLGISSFITQMSIVLVIAFENNLLAKYGEISEYGSDIPITVLGIVMKINQILNSIIIGIAAGAQPIIGYNYGARRFDRVKEVLKKVLGLSLIISLIAFILFQTIPDKLISIFGSGDEMYMQFACLSFRTYLMLCICNGIQIPSGIFFQAIGKSFKSAILSLSRQILFLIPAMVIFGYFFGVKGVLYAGPFADGLAFVIAIILLVIEIKHLNKGIIKKEPMMESNVKQSRINKHVVITIGREYGSGGRYVGKLLSERLGMPLYDKELINEVANMTGLSKEYITLSEQKIKTLDNLNNGYYFGMSNANELFIKESEVIKKKAKKESCIIVGRCADAILSNEKNVFKIFIYSTDEDKVKRAVKYYNMNSKTALKEINKINKLRKNHYKHYTDKIWNNPANYDICLNSDILGVEKTAELLAQIIKEKYNI